VVAQAVQPRPDPVTGVPPPVSPAEPG